MTEARNGRRSARGIARGVWAAVAAATWLAGCSRGPAPEEKPVAAAPPPEPRPVERPAEPPAIPDRVFGTPVLEPAPGAAPPATPMPATDAAAELPLRVCALMEAQDGGGRAGLLDLRSGRSAVVNQGGSFAGYAVLRVDFDREEVVLGRAGREFVLGLSSGAGREETPPRGTPLLPAEAPADFVPKPDKFEPTPDERARGIDPNDPSTWPDHYKGPAIERFLREHPEVSEGDELRSKTPLPSHK